MRLSSLGRPTRRLIAFLLLGFLALALGPTPARAQAPAVPGAPAAAAPAPEIDRKQLEALLKTLEDPAARDALAGQIRALLTVKKDAEPEPVLQPGALGAQTLRFLSQRLRGLAEQAGAVTAAFRDLPLAADWFERQLTDEYRRDRWWDIILQLAAAIFAGFLASAFVSWLLRRPRAALEGRHEPHWVPRLPLLLGRTALELLPIAAFAVAGYGLLSVSEPPRLIRVVALTVINATVFIQLVMVLARAVFTPGVPNLRLLPMEGETAHYGYIWVRRLAYTAVYGYLVSNAAFVLGLPLGAYMALLKLVGLVVAAMLVVLILQNRAHVAAWLRGAPLSGGSAEAEARDIARGTTSGALRVARRRLADVWHILAIAYVVVIYGIWALNVQGGFEFMLRATAITVTVLVVARLLSTLLERLVRRAFAVSPEVRRAYPGLEQRANRYLPVMKKILKGVIFLLAALAILNAWGVDSFSWLESRAGQRVTGSVVTISIVLLVAVASWEFVSGAIERYLVGTVHNGTKVERSARVRTLLPLLRNAYLVLLITVVALIVLSELGLNIAPLLAGAGVIGLAIGFGSQTLVKDVITGLFILFEDTMSVGDVVDVGGGHSGVVEALSIRSLRLRDVAGSVHSIPFSQVATVKNLTKDFSFYVFDIGVSYGEDPDRVVEVVRQLGEELQKDPEYAPLILEPIEIMGVDAFMESAIIVKARVKTRPIMQWKVGREFNRRLKKRFDQLGIEIPFPQRTVHIRADAEVPPERQLLAAKAAAGASD